MKKLITLSMVLLLMFSITLVGCGGTEEAAVPEEAAVQEEAAVVEEVAATDWPAEYSEIPAFTTSPIENLQVIDESTTSMEFQNVTQEDLDAYANELLAAGFTYEPVNGNVYTKVAGDYSYAVGWNVFDSAIKLILIVGPAEDGLTDVVVQWPAELDGITPLQGFTPNNAYMNANGLVTIDYSDVTVEALDAYREALIADGFEIYDIGTGVEAYARVDAEETTFLVVINPQDDVEGHLQISGIITRAE